MDIGRELRRARLSQEMTLDDVAKRCGYSKALISRVETGLTSPSMTSLVKMLASLGLKLHDLFSSITLRQPAIVRKAERRRLFADGKTSVEFLTANIALKKMAPTEIIAPPGCTSGDQPVAHYGEEFIFVLSGKIEATTGGRTHKLGASDSIYLPAGMPYTWRNAGKETARLISVVTPPQM